METNTPLKFHKVMWIYYSDEVQKHLQYFVNTIYQILSESTTFVENLTKTSRVNISFAV